MRKVTDIILGFNLPFFLWSIIAGLMAFLNLSFSSFCLMHKSFGWCPACGLTRSYMSLLKGDGFTDAWFTLIFLLFVANFFWSIYRAVKVYRSHLLIS